MIIIYILLGIIAVGVLVSSEAGKSLLDGIIALLYIAGLLFVILLMVMFGIVFFKSQTGQGFINAIETTFGIIILLLIYALLMSPVWMNRKEIIQRIKNIPANIKNSPTTLKNNWLNLWKNDRARAIVLMASCALIVGTWIFILIYGSQNW